MVAWLKTSRPELARRCSYCGAPRGHYCITSGGRHYGYWKESHKVRHNPRSGSLAPLGHGPCDRVPAGSAWEHFGGHQ